MNPRLTGPLRRVVSIARSAGQKGRSGPILIVIAACGYGSGPLLAKSVYAMDVSWLTLLVWRFLLGALLGWAWVLGRPGHRAELGSLRRKSALALLGLGALLGAGTGAYYFALETVPASLTALIVYAYPALVAVLVARLGYPLQGPLAWMGLAMVTTGVALAIGGIETAVNPAGLALACASPVLTAGYVVLLTRFAGERPRQLPSERAGAAATLSAAVASAVMMTGTFATVTALAAAARELNPLWQVPVGAWPGIVGIATLSTVVAVGAFYAGSARMGAAQAALLSTVEPIYTVVMAALLLGERLTGVQLLGGAIVLSGVFVSQRVSLSARIG